MVAAPGVEAAVGRRWELTYEARPGTLNRERSQHWSKRASATSEWRAAFWLLAREQKVPRLERISIAVRVESKTRRLADVGAAWPATKAAVDGLVDAGVLDDDGPEHVLAVTLNAPTLSDRDAVTLSISEASPKPNNQKELAQ